MARIPRNLYTLSQVRQLDEQAHGKVEGGEYTLMERAGAAVLQLAQEKHPGARRMLVLCGSGNNAGDGYIVARLAQAAGLDAAVYATVDPKELSGASAKAVCAWQEAEGRLVDASFINDSHWDVVIDALVGTGISRPIEGDLAQTVNLVNSMSLPVIAVDLPSGIHGDNGAVMGTAVRASMTMSFIGLKRGGFTGEAPDYCGEIYLNDLGVPTEVFESVSASGYRVMPSDVKTKLAPRAATTHKGQCGHVLVVGGNRGMSGAALLAGQAALRAGAGRVSIATRQGHAATLNLTQPELMCHGVTDLKSFYELLNDADVVALGPGLGQDIWAEELFKACVESDKPLVVDADGLNLLVSNYADRGNWVLTPHPGEAARLTGMDLRMLQKDRFSQARELANHYNATVVLKGAGTLVTRPRRDSGHGFDLIDAGNPGMASGGMGDALTGVIASLMAQGLDGYDAARCGAYVHAVAGDRVARAAGQRGLLASDLMPTLQKLVNP